jgi:alkylation response protein AidB-like acyl-CoA dehydrogenase
VLRRRSVERLETVALGKESNAVIFAFSAEQNELRSVVRAFLGRRSPESEVRRLMATNDGYDTATWKHLATQIGLQGLTIPEEFGGAGGSFVELGIVLEEMGRSLLCAPFFATAVLAANVLLHSGDKAAMGDYLPGMASGDTVATVAFVEDAGRWDAEGIQMPAERDGGQWRLTGAKTFVLDGHTADVLIVAARTADGVSLFAVSAAADGLHRAPLRTLDETRKQARVEFSSTPARLIGAIGAGWTTLARVLDLAAVALAAEQVGGAQRCLDMAVEYAKQRVQFGRPIGSFQAVKHKCADMLLEVETAKSAAYYAMWAAAGESDDLSAVASLAKAHCSDAYFHVAAENIQVHGGIGFTWEHPAHLYFKRAKSSQLLFGDAIYHRGLFAQRSDLHATPAR